jgi:hypothetical protein
VATVTIPAGASSATFNVATINDALAEGTESFTVNLVSASGGNFETLSLAAGGSSVTTAIVDDDVAVVSLSATPSLTEAGGTIVYTATVTQAPLSALTVTLSNGATLVINAGATSGTASVPLAASDDVYVDPSSVSAAITGTSGGGIAVVVDATPAETAIRRHDRYDHCDPERHAERRRGRQHRLHRVADQRGADAGDRAAVQRRQHHDRRGRQQRHGQRVRTRPTTPT